jgi:hypothetical protein
VGATLAHGIAKDAIEVLRGDADLFVDGAMTRACRRSTNLRRSGRA